MFTKRMFCGTLLLIKKLHLIGTYTSLISSFASKWKNANCFCINSLKLRMAHMVEKGQPIWQKRDMSEPGLGSNTYLYLQIQIQIQIRHICICICIWSNFKPCICICIWSTVFGVFDKYVFKYTFSWAVFYKHKFMENKLTWIFFINMLKSAILFQNKCRGLIVLIPIGGCVCALDLACQWVCQGWVSSGRNLFLPGHPEKSGRNLFLPVLSG